MKRFDDERDEDLDEDDDEDDEEEDETREYDAREAVGAIGLVSRFLRPVFRPHRRLLIPLACGVLLETAYNAGFPLCLKYLIDDALWEEDKEALVWILIVLGILGISVSFVTIGYEYLNARLGSAIMADVRVGLFDRVQTLSAGFFSRTKVGEVLSRFTSDLTTVEEVVMHGISWGILPFLELAVGTLLLFYLNWQLAIVAMLVFPLTMFGPKFFSPRAISATYEKKKNEAALLSLIQENVVAQPVVKAFRLHPIARTWFSARNLDLKHSISRVSFLNAMVERSVTIAVLLLHLVILGVGAWLTFHGFIRIGVLVAFEAAFWELSYNIGHLSQFFPVLIQAAGSINHIDDLLIETERHPEPEGTETLPVIQREIRFEHVFFSYDGRKNQLENLSFTIPAGSNVAIVGPSGSGKSTVLSLLLGLHEPTSGKILIDGRDLRGVTRDSLRGQMGIVFQENLLFNTSLGENIRLGNPTATTGDIEAAARAAEIHSFIKNLPEGYETNVGERGTLLSGGQRQRIAIARAVVRNPAILVLDEATSALDHTTEAAIARTLAKLSAGRTTVSVTHRLAAVATADRILVLDKGRLVEAGTHEELLARDGLYARLWRTQSPTRTETARTRR